MSEVRWEVANVNGTFFRENSGAFIIMEGEHGSKERNRVGTVELTVKAKRGEGWRTDDPKALARARLVSAAPELLRVAQQSRLWLGTHQERRTASIEFLQDMLEALDAAISKALGNETEGKETK